MFARMMLMVALGGMFASPLSAAITNHVNFWSGNTEADKATRFYWYEPHTLGPHDPTGHFGDAQAGPLGRIRWDNPNGWSTLPTFKAAVPVFTWEYLTDWSKPFDGSWGSSSLFAVPFYVPNAYVTRATLDLEYSIDNALGGEVGGTTYEGIFINGTAIAGTRAADPGGRFLTDYALHADVGSMLWAQQWNWIYFNVTDTFPQAGIMVGGQFTVTSNPEPASVVAWAVLGLLGLTVMYRRRRRHARVG